MSLDAATFGPIVLAQTRQHVRETDFEAHGLRDVAAHRQARGLHIDAA